MHSRPTEINTSTILNPLDAINFNSHQASCGGTTEGIVRFDKIYTPFTIRRLRHWRTLTLKSVQLNRMKNRINLLTAVKCFCSFTLTAPATGDSATGFRAKRKRDAARQLAAGQGGAVQGHIKKSVDDECQQFRAPA